MSIYPGIEIYSLEDIIISTALGKDIIVNGLVYPGTGAGVKIEKVSDRLWPLPRTFYSTEDIVFRTSPGKNIVINGTVFPSTTGIARQLTPVSRLFQNGINYYSTDNITINTAPGKKVLFNDADASMSQAPATLFTWWDAADTPTITHTAGQVSFITDKSGNARHLQQAADSNRPVTGVKTLNGKNVLDFDSPILSQHMTTSGQTLPQPFTWVAVAKLKNSDTMARSPISAGTSYIIVNQQKWSLNSGSVIRGTLTDINPHVLVGIFNGASSELRVDGVSQAVGNAGVDSPAGSFIYTGRNSQSTTWEGIIAEILTYSGILRGTALTDLETSLKTKWGIT